MNVNSHVFILMIQMFLAFLIYYCSGPEWEIFYTQTYAIVLFVMSLVMLVPIIQHRYRSQPQF
jgi:membrane protein YdbS with pleckstrin-like domain